MPICTHQHSLLRAQMLDQQYLAVATYSTGKFAPKLMALLPIQEVQDEYGAQVRFSWTLIILISQDPCDSLCLCPAVNAAWSCAQPIVQPGGFVSAVLGYLLSIVHSTNSFVFGAASGHKQSVAPRVHSRGRRMCCYCYCVAPVSKMLRPSSTLSRRKMKQHAPGCHAAGAACAFSCSRSACGSCGVEPSAARLENPAKNPKDALSTASQLEPPGLQMVQLPFSDDIRTPEDDPLFVGQGHPVADVDAVDAAADMIAALALPDFYSGSVANPALQRHYEVRDSGVAGFSRTGFQCVSRVLRGDGSRLPSQVSRLTVLPRRKACGQFHVVTR